MHKEPGKVQKAVIIQVHHKFLDKRGTTTLSPALQCGLQVGIRRILVAIGVLFSKQSKSGRCSANHAVPETSTCCNFDFVAAARPGLHLQFVHLSHLHRLLCASEQVDSWLLFKTGVCVVNSSNDLPNCFCEAVGLTALAAALRLSHVSDSKWPFRQGNPYAKRYPRDVGRSCANFSRIKQLQFLDRFIVHVYSSFETLWL
eukprot:1928932-Amphidinium_carterae.1